eukprot:CAMPEP_0170632366 /NCGR_PEP_ID=MMETSP0224-20130122/35280_1 /TAXON_ID=285029 /ORGANISM="Togula jolla, Strain CCCM 725" /LENGTH=127 /DNA_ID=CAMNT_0010961055 /DNA_START=32 /DNA_END=411 /DNA_ORIENTATION=-
MIATISPSSLESEETLFTLNYARRAKMIRVVATKNDEALHIRKLQEEVEMLRQQRVADQTASLQEAPEVEEAYRAQMEVLRLAMQQSWEDKQRLSEQYEEEREKAVLEAKRVEGQVRSEQRRRLELL